MLYFNTEYLYNLFQTCNILFIKIYISKIIINKSKIFTNTFNYFKNKK